MVIFITFVVILITLVVQGLTLTPLIRVLGIVGGNEQQTEEREARGASLRAGAAALERLTGAEGEREREREIATALRRATAYRLERLAAPARRPPKRVCAWPCWPRSDRR